MRSLIRLAAAAALLGTSAHADWLLSDYATVTTDTSKTNEMYGVQTFSNAASTTKVTVPVAGSLKVEATFASDGTNGYTANLGLLHPLTPDWATANIGDLTSIDFDIKTSVKPTDGWEFSFGSKEYGDLASAGTVLLTAFPVATAGAWVHVSITPDMLAYPSWFCDDVAKPCPAITREQVLAATDNIQIAPKTKYSKAGSQNGTPCTACVGPTTAAVTFEIKNVTLKGVDNIPQVNPLGLGCTDATRIYKLDDFVDGDTQNEHGGYWYAFSDTNSAKPTDTATGSSAVELIPDGGGMAIAAALNKKVAGVYHKYAGWAALGTGFAGDISVNMSLVSGIGFKVTADQAFSNKIVLNFKVQGEGIGDDRPHMVTIPRSQMTGTSEVCVRIGGGTSSISDVKQAAWVVSKDALPLSKIAKLSWELKIADQKDPAISEAAGSIMVNDLTLYGIDTYRPVAYPAMLPPQPAARTAPAARAATSCTDGIRPHARPALAAFSARYESGRLSVSSAGQYRSLEIVSVDGARVGFFRLEAMSPNEGLRVDLQPGAYVLVARDGSGRAMSRSLPVVR